MQHQQMLYHGQHSMPMDDDDADGGTGDDVIIDDGVIRCICSYTDDDGYTVQCEECEVWQHVACMGLDPDDMPDKYLCEECFPRPVNVERARALQSRRVEQNARNKQQQQQQQQAVRDRDFGDRDRVLPPQQTNNRNPSNNSSRAIPKPSPAKKAGRTDQIKGKNPKSKPGKDNDASTKPSARLPPPSPPKKKQKEDKLVSKRTTNNSTATMFKFADTALQPGNSILRGWKDNQETPDVPATTTSSRRALKKSELLPRPRLESAFEAEYCIHSHAYTRIHFNLFDSIDIKEVFLRIVDKFESGGQGQTSSPRTNLCFPVHLRNIKPIIESKFLEELSEVRVVREEIPNLSPDSSKRMRTAGVFAVTTMPANTIIGELHGRIVNITDLERSRTFERLWKEEYEQNLAKSHLFQTPAPYRSLLHSPGYPDRECLLSMFDASQQAATPSTQSPAPKCLVLPPFLFPYPSFVQQHINYSLALDCRQESSDSCLRNIRWFCGSNNIGTNKVSKKCNAEIQMFITSPDTVCGPFQDDATFLNNRLRLCVITTREVHPEEELVLHPFSARGRKTYYCGYPCICRDRDDREDSEEQQNCHVGQFEESYEAEGMEAVKSIMSAMALAADEVPTSEMDENTWIDFNSEDEEERPEIVSPTKPTLKPKEENNDEEKQWLKRSAKAIMDSEEEDDESDGSKRPRVEEERNPAPAPAPAVRKLTLKDFMVKRGFSQSSTALGDGGNDAEGTTSVDIKEAEIPPRSLHSRIETLKAEERVGRISVTPDSNWTESPTENSNSPAKNDDDGYFAVKNPLSNISSIYQRLKSDAIPTRSPTSVTFAEGFQSVDYTDATSKPLGEPSTLLSSPSRQNQSENLRTSSISDWKSFERLGRSRQASGASELVASNTMDVDQQAAPVSSSAESSYRIPRYSSYGQVQQSPSLNPSRLGAEQDAERLDLQELSRPKLNIGERERTTTESSDLQGLFKEESYRRYSSYSSDRVEKPSTAPGAATVESSDERTYSRYSSRPYPEPESATPVAAAADRRAEWERQRARERLDPRDPRYDCPSSWDGRGYDRGQPPVPGRTTPLSSSTGTYGSRDRGYDRERYGRDPRDVPRNYPPSSGYPRERALADRDRYGPPRDRVWDERDRAAYDRDTRDRWPYSPAIRSDLDKRDPRVRGLGLSERADSWSGRSTPPTAGDFKEPARIDEAGLTKAQTVSPTLVSSLPHSRADEPRSSETKSAVPFEPKSLKDLKEFSMQNRTSSLPSVSPSLTHEPLDTPASVLARLSEMSSPAPSRREGGLSSYREDDYRGDTSYDRVNGIGRDRYNRLVGGPTPSRTSSLPSFDRGELGSVPPASGVGSASYVPPPLKRDRGYEPGQYRERSGYDMFDDRGGGSGGDRERMEPATVGSERAESRLSEVSGGVPAREAWGVAGSERDAAGSGLTGLNVGSLTGLGPSSTTAASPAPSSRSIFDMREREGERGAGGSGGYASGAARDGRYAVEAGGASGWRDREWDREREKERGERGRLPLALGDREREREYYRGSEDSRGGGGAPPPVVGSGNAAGRVDPRDRERERGEYIMRPAAPGGADPRDVRDTRDPRDHREAGRVGDPRDYRDWRDRDRIIDPPRGGGGGGGTGGSDLDYGRRPPGDSGGGYWGSGRGSGDRDGAPPLMGRGGYDRDPRDLRDSRGDPRDPRDSRGDPRDLRNARFLESTRSSSSSMPYGYSRRPLPPSGGSGDGRDSK